MQELFFYFYPSCLSINSIRYPMAIALQTIQKDDIINRLYIPIFLADRLIASTINLQFLCNEPRTNASFLIGVTWQQFYIMDYFLAAIDV